MRIKPPGDGPPAAGSIDEAGQTEGTSATGAVDAASAAQGAQAVAPATGAQAPSGLDPVAEVARRLRVGEISARDAVEILIDDAVARHGASDRDEVARELKDLLRRYAADDPYLSSKLRGFGTPK